MSPLKGGQLVGSVHDPLYARALVLENGSSKVALVAVDATDLPGGDDIPMAVAKALGIARDHLFMDSTHDHNAPTTGNFETSHPYYALMKKGIVEAALKADAALQPARVGFGRGLAYVNTNRDEKIGAGYHMGYSPDGPSDKTVAVMAVTSPTGAPIAVYANYAVHGVVMYQVHSQGDQIQITGDLPGWTNTYVEGRLGGKAVALWTSGAAGDQNPLFQGDYDQDAPDVIDEGPGAWTLLDVQARRLGEEIVHITRSIQNTSDRAVLWADTAQVTCPGQQRATPPAPGVITYGYRAPPPETVKMVDAEPVTIPLSLVMVNDIALAGVSGEVFTEIGQHVKREAPFDRTMMVTLLPNGIGYIPTDKAYLLPSEKAVGNRIKPGCAEPAMVNAFQGMMNRYLPLWKAAQ
jgi:hypothetical protein